MHRQGAFIAFISQTQLPFTDKSLCHHSRSGDLIGAEVRAVDVNLDAGVAGRVRTGEPHTRRGGATASGDPQLLYLTDC